MRINLLFIAVLIVALSAIVFPYKPVFAADPPVAAENLILSKQYYYASDSSPSDINRGATFEPGNAVYVRIGINVPSDPYKNIYELRDYRPNDAASVSEITSQTDAVSKCKIPSDARLISATNFVNNEDNYTSWFFNDRKISGGNGYLCYKYLISSQNNLPKNILYNGRLSAYSDENGTMITTLNTYSMIRGLNFIASANGVIQLDDPNNRQYPIDDKLLETVTKVGTDNPLILNSYVYDAGNGPKSRGGRLLNLPVSLTDSTGNIVVATDNSYLFYNPLYYLFGNLFGGSSNPGAKFDFGSRGSSISSGGNTDQNNRQNSNLILQDYKIDKNAVAYWDESNPNMNKEMDVRIKQLTGDSKPKEVCVLDYSDRNKLNNRDNILYLDNNNCQIIASNTAVKDSNFWPNGRVWYMKAAGDVMIGTKILKKGTIIVDFQNRGGTVYLDTKEGDFANGSILGLMVINGGSVEFTQGASEFRGILFVPEGKISFVEGGESMKIYGSLVANEIDFSPRKKENSYSIMVYSDSTVLNSAPPGFEFITTFLDQDR